MDAKLKWQFVTTIRRAAWVFQRRSRGILFRLLGFLYGAYLTIRYIDQYQNFPAIVFTGQLIRLHIKKADSSRFAVNGKLFIQPWLQGRLPSIIQLGSQATLIIENDFVIGDDIRICVGSGANLVIGGKDRESASGVTARSTILVNKSLIIGNDVLIAWDTFITDSDHHIIEGQEMSEETVIEDHVWIAMGVKVLKGAKIGSHSIIASGAVVTKGEYPSRILLGGIPARVLKKGISDWHR